MKGNFAHLIALILFIMNEIALFHALLFPLHKTFEEKYLSFLQNLLSFCENLGEWALFSKVFKGSLEFFAKKVAFDTSFASSSSLFVWTNAILGVLLNNQERIAREFLEENDDLLIKTLNFLKIMRNNGKIYSFYAIFMRFIEKVDGKSEFFSEVLFKLATISKAILSKNEDFGIETQKVAQISLKIVRFLGKFRKSAR